MSKFEQPVENENCYYIELSPAQRIWIISKIGTAGEEMIDLRYWCRFKDSVEWVPTKKGIFLRVAQVRDHLIPALQAICK